MSGRGSGRGSYQGGVVQGGQGGRVRGRVSIGYNYYGATTNHKGLCSAIGIHVFDYGHKASADQMSTTWENLVHYVGTIHGHDISNELINKKIVTIATPDHTQDELDEHQLDTERRDQ